jgi:predicted Zn-dependent protease
MRRLAKWQERHGEGKDFTGRGAFDEYPDRWQNEAQRMQEAMHARNVGAEGQGVAGRDSMASGAPMMTQTRQAAY